MFLIMTIAALARYFQHASSDHFQCVTEYVDMYSYKRTGRNLCVYTICTGASL